jgi:hypothetical protein
MRELIGPWRRGRLHNRRHRLGWHVSTELSVTMPKPEGQGTLTLGPDLFVVEADEALRSSWDVRAEGQPPRFVLEVATDKSVERDTAQKPGYYGAMGVEEAERAEREAERAEAEVARLRALLEGKEG